jgi:ABC-type branched-subunit amino acid transport system substrate-binding protein
MNAVLNSDVEVPASALPCANCHGLDGKGVAEGPLKPSDLRWEALTRPYGVTEPGGRTHEPYDEASLRRAITMGFNPAGIALSSGMPRYRFSSRDLRDLIAYIKRLGQDQDKGLTETSIRVAFLLPPEGGSLGEAVLGILAAYFDTVNRGGGVYGRRIELITRPAPSNVAGLRAFCEREQPFAMVNASVDGIEGAMPALVEDFELPIIGPLTPLADVDRSPSRYVFHLVAGLDRQARALVAYARTRGWLGPRKVGLIICDDPAERRVADLVSRELREAGIDPVRLSWDRNNSGQVAALLRAEGVEVVFGLAAHGSTGELIRAASRGSWAPIVLAHGAYSGDLFDAEEGPEFEGSCFLTFPFGPGDRTPEAVGEYRELGREYKLRPGHDGVRLAALGAARVLVEGLRGAGRGLTREALIAALERPEGISTGLMPTLYFRNGRRLGALEVTIVEMDIKGGICKPVFTWGRDSAAGGGRSPAR